MYDKFILVIGVVGVRCIPAVLVVLASTLACTAGGTGRTCVCVCVCVLCVCVCVRMYLCVFGGEGRVGTDGCAAHTCTYYCTDFGKPVNMCMCVYFCVFHRSIAKAVKF